MTRRIRAGWVLAPIAALAAPWALWSQAAPTAYPKMAPVSAYMMADANTEIALARSAAPASISDHAEIMVMGRHDYQTAVKGTNGFVCLVERSWTAGSNDPNFWNPKLRGPLCFNPAGARSYIPITRMKTRLILNGSSKADMVKAVGAAMDQKRLPPLEPGAMCYMLSKQGYLGDGIGHWHPHLMFFVPLADAKEWGADLPGSPVMSSPAPEDRLSITMILVAHWSDGSVDTNPPF